MRRDKKVVAFRVTSSKPANDLRIGDQVKALGRSARITRTYIHQGKKVLVTDAFGLIFWDEVIIQ